MDLYAMFLRGNYLLKYEKYFSIFRISMLHTLRNYKLLLGLCIFEVICLLIFAHIWKVAAARIGVVHLDPTLLLWYIAFNEWILIAVPDIEMDIEHELKTGQLAYFLPRPISYLGAKLAEGFGALLMNMLILGTAAFIFAYLWTGTFPLTCTTLVFTILLGVFAGFLSLIFTMIIGILAFFFQEVEPWRWVWEKLLFAFGGLMLPLTVYPEWLQKIAHGTPFPAILGGRSALIFHFDWQHMMGVISSLLLWTTIGVAFLYMLYKRGLKMLSINAG